MLESFLKYVNQEGLVATNDKILLGISGGIDSMVMLSLFEKAGFNFSVAHCNFNLRGKESEKDQNFIEEYIKEKNIELFTKQFSTKEYATEHKMSIQMAARELRINWFYELITKHNFSFYATAHHLDDQAETFFINLLRGTGIAGIHGILPKQGKLIHPMMFTNRAAILDFAKKNNIKFQEDSSNKQTKYLRNKIRHQVIPILNEIKPGFSTSLAKSIKRFEATERIYKNEIKRIAKKILKKTEDNTVYINISKLKKLPDAVVYLYEIISGFNFNFTDAEDLINPVASESGKVFHSSTHRIIRDRDFYIIEGNKNQLTEKTKYTINESEGKITDPLNLVFEQKVFSVDFEIDPNSNIGYFDFDTLKFPLIIRKWQKGDFFYPLGLNHKKLLSDFFTNNKFNIRDKESTWLLTSGNNIIWIIGHRIDDRFKLTDQTSRISKVSIVT